MSQKCSKFTQLLLMYTLHCLVMSCQTRSNTPEFRWIYRAVQTSLATRSISKSIGIAYTALFNAFQRTKPFLCKSGVRGDQGTGPTRPPMALRTATPNLKRSSFQPCIAVLF